MSGWAIGVLIYVGIGVATIVLGVVFLSRSAKRDSGPTEIHFADETESLRNALMRIRKAQTTEATAQENDQTAESITQPKR